MDSSKRRNDAENLTLLNKSFDDINVRFSALFQRLEESTQRYKETIMILDTKGRLMIFKLIFSLSIKSAY